jgi:hypothetical protein
VPFRSDPDVPPSRKKRGGNTRCCNGPLLGSIALTFISIRPTISKFYLAKGKKTFAADTEARWRLHLQEKFEHVPAHRLTTTMLREYKGERFAEKDKPAVATVNRELQVIRRAFRLAANHEPPKVSRVPKFELETENNAVLEFFTAGQMEKIRTAASARPRLACVGRTRVCTRLAAR